MISARTHVGARFLAVQFWSLRRRVVEAAFLEARALGRPGLRSLLLSLRVGGCGLPFWKDQQIGNIFWVFILRTEGEP